MDFDWKSIPFNLDRSLTLQAIEESFEDPFAIRLLPDSPRFAVQARFFNLGVSAAGQGIFTVFRTNGKQTQVIFARPFEKDEEFFLPAKAQPHAGLEIFDCIKTYEFDIQLGRGAVI